MNLANLESNENNVFYWFYDVGYEGVLLRGLDGYGTVISAAIWVRVTFGTLKSGYGTWVRYVGTVFVPMYRTDRTHVP